MTLRRVSATSTVIAILGLASSAAAQNGPSSLQRIERDRLCVTSGAISALSGGRLAIEAPSSRAVVAAGTENNADQVAEIHFQYLGPSQDSRPLASGELRRQIGLKLRAQDSCNLIYAMWRIEPEARVAVSVKANAGLSTNAQCGARGYVNFELQERNSPPIRPGEAHTLRAALRGHDMTVTADGKVAWRGSVQSAAALPVGPPGLRTDNARFVLEYFTQARRPAQRGAPALGRCVIADGD